MMARVVLFAYRIILNISTRQRVTKILPNKLYCEFNLCSAIKKILPKWTKISCHRMHFNACISQSVSMHVAHFFQSISKLHSYESTQHRSEGCIFPVDGSFGLFIWRHCFNLPAHAVNTANTATTPTAPLNDRPFENTMSQRTSDNSKKNNESLRSTTTQFLHAHLTQHENPFWYNNVWTLWIPRIQDVHFRNLFYFLFSRQCKF